MATLGLTEVLLRSSHCVRHTGCPGKRGGTKLFRRPHCLGCDIRGSIGYRISNGTIYNGSGSKIGEFKSGSIYNSSGSKVGEVRSGTIYKSGSEAGKVNSSGKVYDRSGSQIGEISSNGNIYNKSGSKIGEADHVDAGLAAAIILFDVLK